MFCGQECREVDVTNRGALHEAPEFAVDAVKTKALNE
jgi:hypothetical protein